MRRILTPFSRLVVLAALFVTSSNAAGPEDTFKTFWQKFKTAVISGDKETVAAMSRFPVGMSYGIRSIRNKADLLKRYKQVFNEQTNAAKCFGIKEPEKEGTKKYSVACPDAAGQEVVIYAFELTKTGWKFVALDNINE
jgi:hypothetical protein